ncbi:hypothetical protein GH714_011802 [Hevea brasiliensis]|uniref:Uncharacterized protein n=1 Tax=Hevea brasiliensis TaxID=3981 RepID=A0A6A6KCZ4_HEVBR|nr:hypothetical protein GH714_011802 [Hevea brasiliensis]
MSKWLRREFDIKLRKKFQGMEFRDFYELVATVTKYEELLMEELNRKRTAMGTYYQERKTQMTLVAPPSQYAFDTNKTEEIFDFML